MKVICLVPDYYFHSVLLFQLLKFNHQIRTNKKNLLAFQNIIRLIILRFDLLFSFPLNCLSSHQDVIGSRYQALNSVLMSLYEDLQRLPIHNTQAGRSPMLFLMRNIHSKLLCLFLIPSHPATSDFARVRLIKPGHGLLEGNLRLSSIK